LNLSNAYWTKVLTIVNFCN